MSIFRLVSKIGAIFLTSLLCSNSKAKQPFRFGASSPNPPALLQLQAYAHFFPWSIFSKSNGFAPTPNICPLFPLEHLLQIYRLCSNSRHMPSFSLGASSPNPPTLLQLPMPHIARKRQKPVASATGLCLQFENRYFICFHLLLTCLYYNMHKEFCTFF